MPKPLAHGSERLLEFDQLRRWLSGFAQSALGHMRIEALEPSVDRGWIETQQQLTAEIRGYLRAGGSFDFAGLMNPGTLLSKSRIAGAALEISEVRDILFVAEKASEWRDITLHPPQELKAEWPGVKELSSGIADFGDLLRYFRNKLLPDGSLDDRASPELGRIRRETEKQRRLIQHTLQGYLRRLSEGGAVQEELITIRGERFVIPVKIEQKRRVPGVVHGTSSSGQTVFVEPMETIEQNNDLVRLLEDEQAEIHRILGEMTAKLGESAPAISKAVDVLGELELQFAKARFAEQYDCAALKVLENGGPDVMVLRNARHPLLERNLKAKGGSVVPLTLEMDREHRQLIISGPNTGGKTVGLKTVGLLALMGQAGIPLPADRAELPILDNVLADIGDYQSIEQNLSTFSAHVTNIDFISHTATADSLVLLDELGSATDPEEGAALAVAIAEHFRRTQCVSIISTHHTSLKVYAANTPGVLNAAVGFDENTLAPTYELRVGVPGASAGINIAQRIGLNSQIVSEARAKLSSQTQDVAKFLDRLHSQLRELEAEKHKLQAREEDVAREKKRLETEGLKEQREKVRELEKKLDSLLRDFEYHAREAVNAVQDRAAAQKLSKEAERRIAKARREFREQFNQAVVAHTSGADRGDAAAQPHVVQRVQEGDTVQLKSLGRAGRVTRKLDDQAVEVEIGMMKMRVPLDDVAQVIARVSDNPVKAARARGINVTLRDDSDTAPSEINVIGFNVDDATREVEKFIDRAFLAGMSRVRIVHGSGMGILRKALREYLNSNPQVATVTEPSQKEGGAGATVVELKV
ncbi:MAG TPA: endonuclease MutS2 [Terriglobales bacterium]